MKMYNILATTIVFLLLAGSSSATVFNDGTPISHIDHQRFKTPLTLSENHVQRVYAEGIKPTDNWKVAVWFGLWLIAFSLWASIPVTRNEDE